MLERVEPYKRVVVLSGDVHFASAQSISYWKNQSGAPASLSQHQAAILEAAEVGSLLVRHTLYAEHPSEPGHPRPYVVHTALLATPQEQPPKLGDGPCQDP